MSRAPVRLVKAASFVGIVLLAVGLAIHVWDPKWSGQFWPWAAINLLATGLSEEAFFRGFIQTEIERLAAKRPGGGPAP